MTERSAASPGPPDEHELGQQIFDQASRLAFPRYPGTAGDRRAIGLVAERLKTSGLEVVVEELSYDLSRVWWLLRGLMWAGAAALAGAAWLAASSPVGALAVLLTAVLLAMSLLAWSPWLERLYQGDGPTRTANVCASRSGESPVQTIVLLAHHDSKSQNLAMLTRGALTGVALLATVGVAMVAALEAGRWTSAAPGWMALVMGSAGAAALLMLSTLRSGNASPGGVDNAGSLAVLLELAEALPSAVSTSTELIFLSTGAEEDHMVGAMRWLDRHGGELSGRRVLALNMDGVGAPGRLVLLERYGFGRRFSPELSRLAREVARDRGLDPRGVLMPPAMGIDAIPFANRGIECLTLSSGSLDRATLSVHSPRDRAEHLCPAVLEQAYVLAFEMVRRLDAEGDAPGG